MKIYVIGEFYVHEIYTPSERLYAGGEAQAVT